MEPSSNVVRHANGRPRQHLQHLTAWLVRGFVRVTRRDERNADKRALELFERREAASFRASRRTGSIVQQRFPLPKRRYLTAPFASFSGRTEKGGPARPERMLHFLF